MFAYVVHENVKVRRSKRKERDSGVKDDAIEILYEKLIKCNGWGFIVFDMNKLG